MIKKSVNKSIKKVDILLNSLLDSGLYFVDRKHLNHFIHKYFKKLGKKNVELPYSFVLNNKENFLMFIREEYGL